MRSPRFRLFSLFGLVSIAVLVVVIVRDGYIGQKNEDNHSIREFKAHSKSNQTEIGDHQQPSGQRDEYDSLEAIDFRLLNAANCGSRSDIPFAEREKLVSLQTAEKSWAKEANKVLTMFESAKGGFDSLKLATDGDPESNYKIYRILSYCDGGYNTLEEYDRGIEETKTRLASATSSMERRIHNNRLRQFDYCHGVVEEVLNQDSYLIAAAEQGYGPAAVDYAKNLRWLESEHEDSAQHEYAKRSIRYLKKAFGNEFAPSIPYHIALMLYRIAGDDIDLRVEALAYFELSRRLVPAQFVDMGDECNSLASIPAKLTTAESIQAMDLAAELFLRWQQMGGLSYSDLDVQPW